MYQLESVIKVYGEGASAIHAVDGVSLDINQGEYVVIEGPSGSGKSTLLQMLGALDRPSAGSVMFEGHDLALLPDRKLSELRLKTFGFVFQQFNLVPTLSALENVETALAPLGGAKRKRKERALRMLAAVGLSDRAEHLPSQLSGGEQQRVAIARALSKGPRVILADEPTGNLDTRTGQEIMALLRRLADDMGQTVVLITHDPEIAAAAPRVVRVRDGRVVADASGAELAASAPAMASFGQPAVATLPVYEPVPTAPLPVANSGHQWIETASAPNFGGEAILHAEGVVKHYITETEEVIGVDGVSLIVHPGEFVAITGPSGSGKTTLLNCLSGLDRIDRGRVLISGQTVHDLNDKEQSRLRSEVMGFIFQNWNLVPVFSAVENVELPLLLNGVKPHDARNAAIATLDRIGLGHRLDHHPNALSGGEQQRVAIARALSANPSLVWADEPTGNLDSVTAESVMKLLRELNDDGLAIVLVTHDESIADQATRRIYLRDGRLMKDMTRQDTLNRRSTSSPGRPVNQTGQVATKPTRAAKAAARRQSVDAPDVGDRPAAALPKPPKAAPQPRQPKKKRRGKQSLEATMQEIRDSTEAIGTLGPVDEAFIDDANYAPTAYREPTYDEPVDAEPKYEVASFSQPPPSAALPYEDPLTVPIPELRDNTVPRRSQGLSKADRRAARRASRMGHNEPPSAPVRPDLAPAPQAHTPETHAPETHAPAPAPANEPQPEAVYEPPRPTAEAAWAAWTEPEPAEAEATRAEPEPAEAEPAWAEPEPAPVERAPAAAPRRDPSPQPRQSPMAAGTPEPVRYDDPF